jgi:hypothetical protein
MLRGYELEIALGHVAGDFLRERGDGGLIEKCWQLRECDGREHEAK